MQKKKATLSRHGVARLLTPSLLSATHDIQLSAFRFPCEHSRHRRNSHPERPRVFPWEWEAIIFYIIVSMCWMCSFCVIGVLECGGGRRISLSLSFSTVYKPVNPLNQPFNSNLQKYKNFYAALSQLNDYGKNGAERSFRRMGDAIKEHEILTFSCLLQVASLFSSPSLALADGNVKETLKHVLMLKT